MSFEVITEHLRGAATKMRRLATDLGEHRADIPAISDRSIGDVELAAWLTQAVERFGEMRGALRSSASGFARDLRASADAYDAAADDVRRGYAKGEAAMRGRRHPVTPFDGLARPGEWISSTEMAGPFAYSGTSFANGGVPRPDGVAVGVKGSGGVQLGAPSCSAVA